MNVFMAICLPSNSIRGWLLPLNIWVLPLQWRGCTGSILYTQENASSKEVAHEDWPSLGSHSPYRRLFF